MFYKQKKMQHPNHYNQRRYKEKEEEEKPLIDENVAFHKLSDPTVGKEHNWLQKGPHIVCTKCNSPHGFYIGTKKRLMGFDEEGNMIIKSL